MFDDKFVKAVYELFVAGACVLMLWLVIWFLRRFVKQTDDGIAALKTSVHNAINHSDKGVKDIGAKMEEQKKSFDGMADRVNNDLLAMKREALDHHRESDKHLMGINSRLDELIKVKETVDRHDQALRGVKQIFEKQNAVIAKTAVDVRSVVKDVESLKTTTKEIGNDLILIKSDKKPKT